VAERWKQRPVVEMRSSRLTGRLVMREGGTPVAAGRDCGTLEGVLDWSECPAVERLPGKVSGAWLFKGTRVPVKALFENLEAGARLDEFLEWFPGVSREQVEAVLQHAELSLAEA
jgi:uncharacterized protein (DUF433 family)